MSMAKLRAILSGVWPHGRKEIAKKMGIRLARALQRVNQRLICVYGNRCQTLGNLGPPLFFSTLARLGPRAQFLSIFTNGYPWSHFSICMFGLFMLLCIEKRGGPSRICTKIPWKNEAVIEDGLFHSSCVSRPSLGKIKFNGRRPTWSK